MFSLVPITNNETAKSDKQVSEFSKIQPLLKIVLKVMMFIQKNFSFMPPIK